MLNADPGRCVEVRWTDEWNNFSPIRLSVTRCELAVRAELHYDGQTNGIIFLQFVCPSLVLLGAS